MPDTQTIDPRPEGLYFRWEPHPFHAYLLTLERVNGDGSVASFGCTRDEALTLVAFLGKPIESKSQ